MGSLLCPLYAVCGCLFWRPFRLGLAQPPRCPSLLWSCRRPAHRLPHRLTQQKLARSTTLATSPRRRQGSVRAGPPVSSPLPPFPPSPPLNERAKAHNSAHLQPLEPPPPPWSSPRTRVRKHPRTACHDCAVLMRPSHLHAPTLSVCPPASPPPNLYRPVYLSIPSPRPDRVIFVFVLALVFVFAHALVCMLLLLLLLGPAADTAQLRYVRPSRPSTDDFIEPNATRCAIAPGRERPPHYYYMRGDVHSGAAASSGGGGGGGVCYGVRGRVCFGGRQHALTRASPFVIDPPRLERPNSLWLQHHFLHPALRRLVVPSPRLQV